MNKRIHIHQVRSFRHHESVSAVSGCAMTHIRRATKHPALKQGSPLRCAMTTGKYNDTPAQSQPLNQGSRNEGSSGRTTEGPVTRGAD